MSTELIQTKDYLLRIDEEAEIKEGDYVYDNIDGEISKSLNNQLSKFKNVDTGEKRFVKIIGYYPLTKEAKELDLPVLPDPFKEKTLMEQAIKLRKERGYHEDSHYSFCGGFIEGYKAAQSKQFSLEDIKKAIEMTRNIYSDSSTTENYMSNEEIIQSLSTQQLPKEFIPEYEQIPNFERSIGNIQENYIQKLKTITNLEGKEELIGTYKY